MTDTRIGIISVGHGIAEDVSVGPLGRLYAGQVDDGMVRRGARARLLRDNRVIATDLRIGVLGRKRFFQQEVEPREEIGVLRDVQLLAGRPDLRDNDQLEIYLDDAITVDTTALHGHSDLGPVQFDPIGGFRAHLRQRDGELGDGAFVGLCRGGRFLGEPLRVLRLYDADGRQVDTVRAGQYGAALLGFQGPVAPQQGDVLARFAEPRLAHVERRHGITVVQSVTRLDANTVVARTDMPFTLHGQTLYNHTYARIRRATDGKAKLLALVTDRVPITSLVVNGVSVESFQERHRGEDRGEERPSPSLGLATLDLRPADLIETYSLEDVDGPVEARTATAGQHTALAPPPGTAPPTGSPTARPAGSPAGSPAPAGEPVDVNTAGERELCALPGVTARHAAAAIATRQRAGAFADVEEFGIAAGLQPHEILRLRTLASASPPPPKDTGVHQLDI